MSTPALPPNEKILSLRDGRQLAYSENGNPTSSTMVIFFHGVFGVGVADLILPTFKNMDIHFVAPTIPGWGNSSLRPNALSYAAALSSDIGQLITHLHPDDSNLRIYVSGGSYGTVPAQTIYGAPFDVFPHGRKIVGCVLLAPFSPFKYHTNYTSCMIWSNYISVGPPSKYVPFRILPRMIASILAWRMRSVDKAENMLHEILFDKMTDEEKSNFAAWREAQGLRDGEFERRMAENAVKSVSKTWGGFIEVCGVLHEDWGFRPDELDEEHTTSRPILVVASTEDPLGPGMAKWLADTYRNSELKWTSGGHIASLYEMDAIWNDFICRTRYDRMLNWMLST
ncbi:Alpha/Beta hydrolase protein [Rhodocollybia butyracea]|uniref:Alpha/Beta hydrolase protein n=1 Tax=Rhodocollybia butyracea TaxID=206335 RepID=A0A9P5Q0F3_9AGAR|nr:Alpha/Beta hydrolase protein [Rhodocollybia butyracea]